MDSGLVGILLIGNPYAKKKKMIYRKYRESTESTRMSGDFMGLQWDRMGNTPKIGSLVGTMMLNQRTECDTLFQTTPYS